MDQIVIMTRNDEERVTAVPGVTDARHVRASSGHFEATGRQEIQGR